jgi:Skp family chaperone for outer membrane proteins
MRRFDLFCVLTCASLGFTGCGQMGWSPSSSQRGGIAVVDLDKVAAETGRNRELAQSIQLAGDSLNQQLAKTVESAKEQLEAKKKGYGEELTESEQKELSQWTVSANNQLTQIQSQARQKYEQFKQQQIAQFRQDVKPIAQEVAAKRGLSVVVPKNEGLLLAVDPGIDITDDVIKVMREKRPMPAQPVATPSPAPKQTETAETDETPKKSATKRSAASAKPAGASRAAKSNDDQDSFR